MILSPAEYTDFSPPWLSKSLPYLSTAARDFDRDTGRSDARDSERDLPPSLSSFEAGGDTDFFLSRTGDLDLERLDFLSRRCEADRRRRLVREADRLRRRPALF